MNLLITEDDRGRLLAHGEARAAGRAFDPVPVVRLFTPDAHLTWLLAALDPADGDTAYGLIDLGLGMPALGTVKLSDLESIVGPRKQPVMRDLVDDNYLGRLTTTILAGRAQPPGALG